ncbi:hypothetical protein XENTR_v10011504 [Xenopus tropicalis]|nr:hypothetical protein XENTR_v10011504 [Xenopus tropicalis]
MTACQVSLCGPKQIKNPKTNGSLSLTHRSGDYCSEMDIGSAQNIVFIQFYLYSYDQFVCVLRNTPLTTYLALEIPGSIILLVILYSAIDISMCYYCCIIGVL